MSLSAGLDGSHDIVWIGFVINWKSDDWVGQKFTTLGVLITDSLINIINRVREFTRLRNYFDTLGNRWLEEKLLNILKFFFIGF